MFDFCLKFLEYFYNMLMLQWGGDMVSLDFDEIMYYVKLFEKFECFWDEVFEEIK